MVELFAQKMDIEMKIKNKSCRVAEVTCVKSAHFSATSFADLGFGRAQLRPSATARGQEKQASTSSDGGGTDRNQ
jgi:hypothetical protein